MIVLPIEGLTMTDTDRTVLDQVVSETKKEIAPEMKDDEFFELFCAQNVLLQQQLESEEIESGLIGGDAQQQTGSDGGIDAIYVLVNGRFVRDASEAESLRNSFKQNVVINVVVVQASTEKGFKLQRLLRFKDTMEDIFSLDRTTFSESYNQGLREAIETFRALHQAFATKHAAVHVSYFYVTKGDTATISPDVHGLKQEIENKAKKILATIKACSVVFIGARELFELANSIPTVSHPLRCSDSVNPAQGGACVALVALTDYVKFLTDEKGGLRTNFFEANVRDYQGEVAVNEAIQDTLNNPGDEEFWWLNNGITIVAQKLGGHPKELILDDPQIVNGLQTSQKIFDHFGQRSDLKASDKRELLIRVIQVNNPTTHDRIIEATNSQTRMAPSSLWATRPIHRDIETVFRADGLYYDRRKTSYRRKGIPLVKVVGISELAQSVGAILLQEPDHARARPATRYFQEKSNHDKVFSEKYDIHVFSVCVRIRKTVDSFLRTQEPDRGHRNNLLFYVMMVATCFALRTQKARHERVAGLHVDKKFDEPLLREALKFVLPIYKAHGANDRAAKGTVMLQEIKDELRTKFGRKSNRQHANHGGATTKTK
jgi:hypothetical protein